MGLFNKLKSEMNGGVKVRVEAPSSIQSGQSIPVNVTITSDTTQTIKATKVELKVTTKEEGLNFNNQGVGVNDQRTMAQTVAQAEDRESFTINPGETKTLNLQLYLDSNANPQMPNMGGGKIGGFMQAVATAAQGMERINFIYSVHASVDVDGHGLNPSDQQPIQIIPASAQANPIAQPIDNFQSASQSQPQTMPDPNQVNPSPMQQPPFEQPSEQSGQQPPSPSA